MVSGIIDDLPGFPCTPPGVDVLEGGKLISNNVDPLQSRFMSCFRSNSHVGSAVLYTRFAQGVRVSAPGLFVH